MKSIGKLFGKCSRALFAAIFLIFPLAFYAQSGAVYPLTAESLQNGKVVHLDDLKWKYRAGDDLQWAASDFDDRDWKLLTNDEINDDPVRALENWNGRAWFRLRLQVADELVNQPLAMRVWHWGAAQVYLDGALIQSSGVIEANTDQEFNPGGVFVPIVFTDGGSHTIAVRYSFATERNLTSGVGTWLARGEFLPGFLLEIESARVASERIKERADSNRLDHVFTGLLLALAFVHFLLFAFYPRARGNLYYSVFVAGLGATILANSFLKDASSATFAASINIARQITQATAIMSLLAFLYFEFAGGRFSRFFWVLLGLWIIVVALVANFTSLPFPYFLVLLIVTLADSLRIIVQSLIRRQPGAWNIAAGVGVLTIGVLNNIAFERKIHFLPDWLHEINLDIAIFAVPIAVSIYLAREFARTNKTIAAQMEREMEHEKEKARLAIVEAENERRAKELEEARQLQLSMLPKKLPQIANLEIAAYMKPATEVGGDYYDFHVSADGTLTVAVGDATGHGLKAGTVVTAAKSLFNVFAANDDIPQIFRQSSEALKAMKLRGLFMAMTMMKIKNNNLAVSIAGMPPLLIYRAATAEVEEIALKALPLGGVAKFVYQQVEMNLAPGDCVVALSDGFPEMFNEAGEMFGFDKAPKILKEISHAAPQEMIDRFVAAGENWAGARAQDDDVTFVVVKVKSESANK